MKKKQTLQNLQVSSFTTQVANRAKAGNQNDSWTGACCKTYVDCDPQILL